MTGARPLTEAEHRRQRRLNRIVLPLVAVGSLVVPSLAIVAAVQHQQIAGLSRALDTQRQQAVQAGQSPAVPDSGQVKKNPAAPLPTPSPGKDGRNGLSLIGASLVDCHLVLKREDGARFDVGRVCGADGSPGPSGSPGADGTDGSPGPTGSPGADGKDGADGRDGTDGHDGKDGEPPASYTIPSPWEPNVTLRCDRNPGSPDSAPTYTCNPAAGSSGTPTP